MIELSELQVAVPTASQRNSRGAGRNTGGMDFAQMLQKVQEDRSELERMAEPEVASGKRPLEAEESQKRQTAETADRGEAVEEESPDGSEGDLQEEADEAPPQAQLSGGLQEEVVQIAPAVYEGAEGEEEQAIQPLARWQIAATEAQGDGGREAESAAAEQENMDEFTEAFAAPANTADVDGLPAVDEGANPLELLSFNEMMDPDLVVEQSPEQILTRIQQAAASNNMPVLDEVADAIMPQVVRGLATLVRDGMAEMRLQLQPADLGEIEMRVRTMDGVVRGQMMVQHPEIKQLLESQIERLRDALQEQGLELQGFDVDVESDRQFNRFDQLPNRPRGAANSPASDAVEESISQPSGPVRLSAENGDVHYLV